MTPSPNGCRFAVRVQPRSSRSEIVGVYDEALRVRLTAPPVEGEANAALVELLADQLGIARSRVSVLIGHAARTKVVEVAGMTEGEVRARLTG